MAGAVGEAGQHMGVVRAVRRGAPAGAGRVGGVEMRAMGETTTTTSEARTAFITHPDIFTPEEAQHYLKLPTMKSFDVHRREHGIRGVRFGRQWRYSREQLDALRLAMFGMDGPKTRRRA